MKKKRNALYHFDSCNIMILIIFSQLLISTQTKSAQNYLNIALPQKIQENQVTNQLFSEKPNLQTLQPFSQNQNKQQTSPQNNQSSTPIIPKYVWVYKNQTTSHHFLLNALYNNALESEYKFIVLDDRQMEKLFTKDRVKQVRDMIKESVVEKDWERVMRDWVMLEVLKLYGGVFVDSNIFLTQRISKIKEYILHSPVLNRWGEFPEVFMLHLNPQNQSQNKDRAIFFNNFYHTDIEQAWGGYYDLGLIAAVRQSRLITQWLQTFSQLLGISYQTSYQQPVQPQPPTILQKCLSATNTPDRPLNSISAQTVLHCLLKHRQHSLNTDAFNQQKELDFISTSRYYKIWSVSSSKHLYELKPPYKVQLQRLVNDYRSNMLTERRKGGDEGSTWMGRLVGYKAQDYKKVTQVVNLWAEMDKSGDQAVEQLLQWIQSLENQQKRLKEQQYRLSAHRRLQIPHHIYTHSPNVKSQRLLHQLNIKNLQFYASQNNHAFTVITPSNLAQLLPATVLTQIHKIYEHLEQKLQFYRQQGGNSWFYAQKADELSKNIEAIKTRLIVYHVIHHNGGVFIDKQLTLLESLQHWVYGVMSNKAAYTNCGDRSQVSPMYLAFYNPDYSSLKHKQNIPRNYPIEKQLVLYPSMQDHFLAGVREGHLLKEVLDLYIDLLFRERAAYAYEVLNGTIAAIGKTNLGRGFAQGHMIAIHAVLYKRQREIDAGSTQKTGYRKLAVDQYGLITINMHTSTHKHMMYCHGDNDRCYIRMSKLTLKQFQYQTGPMQFAMRIDDQLAGHIEWKLKTFDQTATDYILENSLLNRYFVQVALREKLIDRKITVKKLEFEDEAKSEQVDPLGQQWTRLEKNIWVIWDTGIVGHSNIYTQLAFDNLKRSAFKSGFIVHSVNQNNIHQLLDPDVMSRIDSAIKRASFAISKQGITDAWRMALVLKHGGVYLDASSFTTGSNFDWVTFVSRLPRNLIWNRYGENPQAIVHFNQHYGAPLQWHYDELHHTKSQSSLAYQNNFFAAVKGSIFISEWLDVFLNWIVIPQNDVHQQMKMVGMKGGWLSPGNRYLTAMEAMRYVTARKQKEIQQNYQYKSKWRNAPHFFKVWSFSGHMIGQQKLRDQNAYENKDYREQQTNYKNYFRFKYDMQWSEMIIGRVKYQSKLFGWDTKFSNQLFQRVYLMTISDSNTTISQAMNQIIHPNSIFSRVFDLQMKLPQLIKFYLGKDDIQTRTRQKLRQQQITNTRNQQKQQLRRKYKIINSLCI